LECVIPSYEQAETFPAKIKDGGAKGQVEKENGRNSGREETGMCTVKDWVQ
jgi:hypothetical protein